MPTPAQTAKYAGWRTARDREERKWRREERAHRLARTNLTRAQILERRNARIRREAEDWQRSEEIGQECDELGRNRVTRTESFLITLAGMILIVFAYWLFVYQKTPTGGVVVKDPAGYTELVSDAENVKRRLKVLEEKPVPVYTAPTTGSDPALEEAFRKALRDTAPAEVK